MTAMQIRLDADVNALYITLRPGRVARTIEITDTIYVDEDEAGVPLGIEFVNADEFLPFLRDRAGDAAIPAEVRAVFWPAAA